MDHLIRWPVQISDLHDFPFHRAAEWTRITSEKKNPNRCCGLNFVSFRYLLASPRRLNVPDLGL